MVPPAPPVITTAPNAAPVSCHLGTFNSRPSHNLLSPSCCVSKLSIPPSPSLPPSSLSFLPSPMTHLCLSLGAHAFCLPHCFEFKHSSSTQCHAAACTGGASVAACSACTAAGDAGCTAGTCAVGYETFVSGSGCTGIKLIAAMSFRADRCAA